ncbi:unnamed protein product [Prorocentrum cordatum]|uniref:Secreted protein n=1 Tax=Prorocentrum cordatum TaxID=2364126 RepID=A0ABN9U753_9DINO|nr:unnamed protein product [Polarella glacialis]
MSSRLLRRLCAVLPPACVTTAAAPAVPAQLGGHFPPASCWGGGWSAEACCGQGPASAACWAHWPGGFEACCLFQRLPRAEAAWALAPVQLTVAGSGMSGNVWPAHWTHFRRMSVAESLDEQIVLVMWAYRQSLRVETSDHVREALQLTEVYTVTHIYT